MTDTVQPGTNNELDCRTYENPQNIQIDGTPTHIYGDPSHGFVIFSGLDDNDRGRKINYSTPAGTSGQTPGPSSNTAGLFVSEGSAADVDTDGPATVTCAPISRLQDIATEQVNNFLDTHPWGAVDADTVTQSGKRDGDPDKQKIYTYNNR